MFMKKTITAMAAALLCANVHAQCNPIGWMLVDQKLVSITERMCVYEKNGARMTIMVSGFCPLSPC